MKRCVILLLLICTATLAQVIVAQDAARITLTQFDKPPLFAYGTWQGKAAVEGGKLRIAAPSGQGGLGYNFEADYGARGEFSPQLSLKIGAAHKAKTIKLLLKDDKTGEGTWEFSLQGLKVGETIMLLPTEGAALAVPNALGKDGAPNLSKLRQWQIIGDWSGDAFDVEISGIALVAADDKIRAARAEQAARLLREAEAKRNEQNALKAKYRPATLDSPRVERVSMVSPDVIAIEIQAGRLVPGVLQKYEVQAGDAKKEKKNDKGEITEVILQRGGKEFGWLIGKNREWLTPYEQIVGDPLLEFVADDASNFAVNGAKPLSVFRKSKPNGWAQGAGTLCVRHTLFLKLPQPLNNGQKYTVTLGALNTSQASTEFICDAANVRSEAVHVNQIGYRPNDPQKRAFVSCWLGTGGALTLPEKLPFSLVDEASGQTVFTGQGQVHFPASKAELMARDANFNGTDVAQLDFSAFKTAGRYRVVVPGFGCSYPFEIAEGVWKKAFLVQMRGLFHQRSGVELGPPFTDYKKPRDMHPADGYAVTKTRYRFVEKGGEAWSEIVAGDTGEAADGWGGYHDAGDWNPRRVTHMKITLAQLEMLDIFPEFFTPLKLNIPATKGVPDILTEAMFEVDCFRRLQNADGGVPYGIESKGDPLQGEVSWLNSFGSYVFAPDYYGSWYYAAVAAQLGFALQKHDAKLAATYRESALHAFAWAEKDYAAAVASGEIKKHVETWRALDARNLAALALYRLTREDKFHTVFLENTLLRDTKPNLFQWGKGMQSEQAFLYARLPAELGEAQLKSNAVAGLREQAERALNFAANNAFNVTTPDKGKPQFLGYYSTPDAADLTRAHFLTGEANYLAGVVQATQFQSGCNPNNLVYITGLGANPVQNTFKLDARRTGQKVPAGLVPYGNIDFGKWNHTGITWPITWYLGKVTTPNPYAWPTSEAYWDLGGWPMLEEFTVDAWAPNVLVWGYLAARP